MEETFLRGTRTLTLGQMSVSLKLSASALSGKISLWFDPVCGTKLEAMVAPETALRKNVFLTGQCSTVLSFRFSLSPQTQRSGCHFSFCMYYSSRWALIAALCMTYQFEWVHQLIFSDLMWCMHLTAARYTYLHALFFYPLSVGPPSCMFIKYTPSPHPHLPKASSSDKYLLLGLQIYLQVLQLWKKTPHVGWFLVRCCDTELHSVSSGLS